MTALAPACRLSGEPLADAELLFEIADCPIPGIYPASASESASLRAPLRVVQARQSGFVQLGHVFDSSLYQQYAFAGGGSASYRRHLETIAIDIVARFAKSTPILEVGCGDGWLLRRLRELGFDDVLGIDPSRSASEAAADYLVSGYFPQDLPPGHRHRKFDLVISRHVLEHIEIPRAFMTALVASLSPAGELWIEVPDLDSSVARNLWSNFYQLHCNYFSAITLDQMAAVAGLRCVAAELVDIFGGSLLRKYVHGVAGTLPQPARLIHVHKQVEEFRTKLFRLSAQIPLGTVGYGAAERTAVTLGFAPALASALAGLCDGNPLLNDRYLAGTSLRIRGKEAFFQQPPPAVLLFAISNAAEILAEWRTRLPGDFLVGIVGGEFPFRPLKTFS
jgi:2-polyprenyl-3-methyl-5-hydroxy-6-metoxy-1,4-benzoquinol methylase